MHVCGEQRESKELSVPPLLLLWEEDPVLSLGYFLTAPVSYPKVSAMLSAGGPGHQLSSAFGDF